MASWPLISDFARVLQNPQVAFRDPGLKGCTVEMNHLGQPKARSGNFATVYRGFRPDGDEFAIRVFNRRQDERLEHYRAISRYLEHRSVSSIVRFEYDDRGIRSASDGKMYPLLTMHWVPGITLFEWTRDRCREGYAEALRIAADVWLHLVRELQTHQIVHGDLQHGNVLVSPEGHFKLVDYDCMCVPELLGRRNPETGLPPYQHPRRNVDTRFFPGLDHFSSLLVYVALRALAAAPRLWMTHVDQTEYDRLLFRAEDFERPAASRLYRELLQSPDEQVRDLTHYLFELAKSELHDVPAIDEVLLWCESIEHLISEREWDKVVQLVSRMGPEEQLAAELEPWVREARQRVECRQAAERALAEGHEERLEQLAASGLLDDYPAAAHLVEPASRAAEARGALRVLSSALQLRAWDKLKSTWLAHQLLLRGRASAKPYEREVQKLFTVDRVRELLATQPVDDRALAEAWSYLQKLGGHPLAESLCSRVEPHLARQRALACLQEALIQAPAIPTLAHDKQIAAAMPAAVAETLDPESPLVRQYRAAQRRLGYVRKVHQLERAGSIESETFIANVMHQLPRGYHDGLAKRAQQAQRRIYIYRQLLRVVQDGLSEQDIFNAWDALGQVRGRVLADAAVHRRAELAAARLERIRRLRQIPDDTDERELERRVQEVWDPELMDGCAEAEAWQEIYQRSAVRRQLLKQLEQSVADERLDDAERLLADPRLAGQALPADVASRMHELRTAAHQAIVAQRQALVNSLRENDRAAFAALFDPPLVADICRQFRHHQPVVSQWVEAEILPAMRLGLVADPQQPLLRDEEHNRLLLKWLWPPPRVSQRCWLKICSRPPNPLAHPEDVPALHAATIARADGDPAQGYPLAMDAAWEACHAYVWAEVDLGFQVFFSTPCDLGAIPAAAAPQRRWSLFGRSRGLEQPEAEAGGPAGAAAAGEPDPPPAP